MLLLLQKSMILVTLGLFPCAFIPRTALPPADGNLLLIVISPKSAEFPRVESVIYWILPMNLEHYPMVMVVLVSYQAQETAEYLLPLFASVTP